MNYYRIDRPFFERSTVIVARELLGAYIVRAYQGNLLVGMICETEAYQGADDAASHAYRGITPRNAPMFGPCGYSYVYFIYGKHFCFNVVAHEPAHAGAVLIRGICPMAGVEIMQTLRKRSESLTNGPAKLTQAFAIDRSLNNRDLITSDMLYLAHPNQQNTFQVHAGPRIGISQAHDMLWRFVSVM